MVFPATRLPSVTELLINGAWVDITGHVRVAKGGRVEITRGRSNESGRVTPSRLNATLDNRDGRYSNRLPTSAYYGLIGRNTQLRHRLRWVFDTFTRTVSSGLGSDESPAANAWTILSGLASDWNVSAVTGMATVLCSAASISRSARVGPVLADARTTGLVKPGVVATGAQIDQGFILRRDNATDTYYEALARFEVGGTMRLRVNKVIAGAATNIQEVVLSGTYTAATLMWVVADVKGSRIRVRAWDSTTTEPVAWHLDFTDSSVTTPGQYGGLRIRVQAGNTNVPFSPGWSSVDVSSYRFWGEVPSWPQTWDRSGSDVTAPIEAAGVMRRLSAGAKPLRSAMYATFSGISEGDFVPVAYWPLEDGNDATSFAGAVGTEGPALFSGSVQPAGYSDIVGSASIATIGSGGRISASIPAYSATGIWQIQWVMNIPSQPAANTTYLDFTTTPDGGGGVRHRIYYDSGTTLLTIQSLTSGGTVLSSNAIDAVFGTPFVYAITQFQNAGSVVNVLSKFDATGSLQQTTTLYAGTVASITGWTAYGDSNNSGWALGHVAVYTDDVVATPNIGPNAAALDGHAGETAAARMTRLCRENGIYFEVTGDANSTALVGPQQRDTLLNVLSAAAEVDGGILYEPRDNLGLAYRTLGSLYNQTGLSLNYSASQIFEPFQPTEDDQLVLNDSTARRVDGSWARAVVDEGSLSTQPPPDGIGTYDEDRTYNAYTDGDLQYIAGRRVRVGTWDEARFPQVKVKLHAPAFSSSPSLSGQVAAVDVGDYLAVSNPPAWIPPDLIELLAQGYRETHRSFEWEITYNAVPAQPYRAFVIGDQTNGRLDTSGCIVNEAVNSSATSIKLCIWDGPPSITTASRPGDFPFDVGAAGERLRVTAMAAVTVPTFVAAGTASTGSSGSRTPGMPAGVVSGDLILIFASTRNSGTGTVDTPSGWAELLDMGNASLLGRIYDGVWTMPTVTFTGGAANEDTIAQSCALRNMCVDLDRVVHSWATQLNASAQNIATPLLGVRRDNCVVLYLGWKQDDYTNVNPISGATEIGEASTAAGNDASQVWDYVIQTTKAGIDETSFTVTGGAAAISRGAVVALVGGTQTATVTRSINTVAKSQTAGTPVALWRPAIPAR